MSHTTSESVTVQSYLDHLQVTRNAEWDADRVRAHAALRQSLEDDADRARFVHQGDVVDPFTLQEADGGEVVLSELLATGPVVLIFFRFEGCPACNAALQGYQETLAAPARELGAQVVAISPQVADRLRAIKRRHQLDFLVAADPEGRLIDIFGIGFAPDTEARQRSIEDGQDLGAVLGTGSWTLPYPTTVVIGQDGVVRFADVHPNWMVRTESSAIIEVLRQLTS